MLLADEVEDNNRDDGHHQASHHSAHIDGTIAALKVLNSHGNRLVLAQIERQVRQQVVVPNPHCLQNRNRHDRRLHDRHHDLEENAGHGSAVNHCGLFQRLRNALDHTGEDEHGQACAESQVHNAQAPRSVELQHIGELRKREHHHLERHDHVEQEQRVQQLRSPVVHTHDPPCAHRSAHQDQNHRADRDQQGPAEAGEEIRGFNATGIVFQSNERLAGRDGERITRNIRLLLEGVDDHQHDREDPCQRHQGKQYGPQSAMLDLFSGNHASTSLEVVSLF